MRPPEYYLPLGWNGKRERGCLAAAFAGSFLFSLGFIRRCWRYRLLLLTYAQLPAHQQLGPQRWDFVVLLNNALGGFALLALLTPLLALAHYAWHYQGSRSIYLMRRLPNRGELARRCLAYPLAVLALSLLSIALLLLLYFAFYRLTIPAEYYQPGQWQLLWTAWLGGPSC